MKKSGLFIEGLAVILVVLGVLVVGVAVVVGGRTVAGRGVKNLIVSGDVTIAGVVV